ncbi:hypothetical protein Tamer19_35400 [Cupriavidus sp. TA19]|uniref:hypothetical protein n=1 Tax=unclassified Cupriavidus TaxID=2640874 RepID=UPI000E2FDB77|nr:MULTISPECIES: hypothetical protein [unclassified Cupriavidus]BDB23896.1 hypothetical protein CTP10_R12380 [Cupriavidus sp. P-10]GLC94132.1 hypothetical protein Tamer19_35400 [Cupriavidus sp. TA19]
MHKKFARTLLATAALAAGLSLTAHAGVGDEATRTAAHVRNGQRDAFSDGAHGPATEATMLPVVARQGMSVCAVRGFDPYRDGMRKPDPYTDGARMGQFDPFTEGTRISSRDSFSDGERSGSRDGGECLTATGRESAASGHA